MMDKNMWPQFAVIFTISGMLLIPANSFMIGQVLAQEPSLAVDIVEPLDRSIINSSDVLVNGTVSGDSLSSVEILVDNVSQGNATLSDSTFTMRLTLVQGEHNITAVAKDTATNTATDSVQITTDTTVPTIIIASPSESVVNSNTVTINGTASDNTGIQLVKVKVDDGPFDLATGRNEWSFVTTVTNGSHTISAQATDLAGNTNTASVGIVVDTQAPQVSITSPSNASILNTSGVIITGTASDNNGVTSIEVSIDGGSFQTAIGTLGWSFATTLGDGIHMVVAKATDNFGNSGEDIVLFVIDTQPPTVAISSPSNGALINTSNVSIGGTATSDSAIVSVKVSIDGSQPILALFNSTSGTWSFNAAGLEDGEHGVNTTATDSAGNEGKASLSFIVDTIAPNISITSPVNGTTLTIPSVMITGSASDANAISSVKVSIDDGTANTANFNSTSGNWSFQTIMTNGNHTIEAMAIDMAGNTKVTSASIVMNAAVPAVTITSPLNGSKIKSTNVTLSGTASSGSSLESIKVSIDGTVLPASFNSTANTWTLGPITLQEGNHTAVATARDVANNVASASVSFIIDITPPKVAITSPSNGSTLNSSNVTINGTASDANGISSVQVSLDGSTFLLANGTLSWSFVTTIANGNHTITAKAADMAGNTSSSSIAVRVQAEQQQPTSNSIQGLVFSDANNDGIRQVNDTGIQGWSVWVGGFDERTNRPILLFTNTNVNGTYKFANMASGLYMVKPQPKEGITATFPSSGSYMVTIPLSTPTSFNFGIHLTHSSHTDPGEDNGSGSTEISNCVLRGKIVIEAASVTINNCDIRGSLRIVSGATVNLQGSSIRGNIKVNGGDVTLVSTDLRGNIHAKNGFLSLEDQSEIIGNVKTLNTLVTNDGTITMTGKIQEKYIGSGETNRHDKPEQDENNTRDSQSTKSSSAVKGSEKKSKDVVKGGQDTEKTKVSKEEKKASGNGNGSKEKGKSGDKSDVGKSDKDNKGKGTNKSDGKSKGKGNDDGKANGSNNGKISEKGNGKGKGKSK